MLNSVKKISITNNFNGQLSNKKIYQLPFLAAIINGAINLKKLEINSDIIGNINSKIDRAWQFIIDRLPITHSLETVKIKDFNSFRFI